MFNFKSLVKIDFKKNKKWHSSSSYIIWNLNFHVKSDGIDSFTIFVPPQSISFKYEIYDENDNEIEIDNTIFLDQIKVSINENTINSYYGLYPNLLTIRIDEFNQVHSELFFDN